MIYINDIPSLRNPDNGDDLIIDDRKEKVPLINGTTIQNGGVFFGGFQLSCVFAADNFARFKNLWLANSTVSYTDKNGVIYSDLTIKLNKFGYVDHFHDFIKVEFELWKISHSANDL